MNEQADEKRTVKDESSGLPGAGGSEASKGMSEATESCKARTGSERLVETEQLMEEILTEENLEAALKRVIQNEGAAGIDGVKVEELPSYLVMNWDSIREQLLQGSYQPQPVKRVEIPKPNGGMRQLGIPTVRDRYIQQAVQQVLQKYIDPTFSEYSYGFRPGKSAHQAIEQAQQYVSSGLQYVVDIDLEKFFDQVNHDILMGRLANRIKDKRVLKLIRAYLKVGIMENGVVKASEAGTPQGGPLSPLLSNVLLDELDRELEKRGHRFVRYADDCNIYVSSERAGKRVMQSITLFLKKRLRLKVNQEKSAVGKPSQRKFLGFCFTAKREAKRRIAPQAIQRMKDRIRKLTSRKRGNKLTDIIKELASYLNGWLGYFGFCQTPSVLEKLEQWTRRKLRCLIWKRWKNAGTRYARLKAFGLSDIEARGGTGNGRRGPWRMSLSPPLGKALSIAFFRSLGLPHLRCKTA